MRLLTGFLLSVSVVLIQASGVSNSTHSDITSILSASQLSLLRSICGEPDCPDVVQFYRECMIKFMPSLISTTCTSSLTTTPTATSTSSSCTTTDTTSTSSFTLCTQADCQTCPTCTKVWSSFTITSSVNQIVTKEVITTRTNGNGILTTGTATITEVIPSNTVIIMSYPVETNTYSEENSTSSTSGASTMTGASSMKSIGTKTTETLASTSEIYRWTTVLEDPGSLTKVQQIYQRYFAYEYESSAIVLTSFQTLTFTDIDPSLPTIDPFDEKIERLINLVDRWADNKEKESQRSSSSTTTSSTSTTTTTSSSTTTRTSSTTTDQATKTSDIQITIQTPKRGFGGRLKKVNVNVNQNGGRNRNRNRGSSGYGGNDEQKENDNGINERRENNNDRNERRQRFDRGRNNRRDGGNDEGRKRGC